MKKEYRYQFLRFETVGTGKWFHPKEEKDDLIGLGVGALIRGGLGTYEITKEIAVVFDKQTGIVKQTEIKRLNNLDKGK